MYESDMNLSSLVGFAGDVDTVATSALVNLEAHKLWIVILSVPETLIFR